MLSQKRAVRDLDIYGKTAAKFLSLIPRCCRPESLPPPEREEEHAAWAKGTYDTGEGELRHHSCHPPLIPRTLRRPLQATAAPAWTPPRW